MDKDEAEREYDIRPIDQPEQGAYDAVVLAVAHQQFKQMSITDVRALTKNTSVIYDLKYLFPADQTDARL